MGSSATKEENNLEESVGGERKQDERHTVPFTQFPSYIQHNVTKGC
jgi:hypothetical protein